MYITPGTSASTAVRQWERTFESWASPPGETEQKKCENAERAVRSAINGSSTLSPRSIRVFPQGSYRNRTNVRADSDVDIGVLCTDSIFFDLPTGMTAADFGISTPALYSYADYKNDVYHALTSHFGERAIVRGNKAFDVHETTYRVDADVVACFEYRWYRPNGTYLTGAAFLTDGGHRIINWPEQHYANGVKKNDATGRRFKDVVRILKRLRNEMDEQGIAAAKPIPSYLIECLAWNVPNEGFGHDTYTADIRYALAHLFNNTRQADDCKGWVEINELKSLFHISQPWTHEQTHAFVSAAWDYVGLE